MTNTLISAVVPVYNVEHYLDNCIESLLAQTYDSIEIILVNDGSTDNSGQYCDRYSNKYPDKIKVIHKNNQGLNYARRDGFIASNGELITFIDSDDRISKNFIQVLKNKLDKYNADMAATGFVSFSSDAGLEFSGDVAVNDQYESDKKTLLNWLIIGGAPWNECMYVMTAWGKLYRRDVIKKIDWDFSNYRANEDEFWTLQAFDYSENGIVFTDSKLYGYRENLNSITRKTYVNEYNGQSMDKFEFIGHLYEKSIDYLGKEYDSVLVRRLSSNIVDFVDIYIDRKYMNLNNVISCQRLINRHASIILNNQPSPEIERKIKRMVRFGVVGYMAWRYAAKHRLSN